MYSQHLNNKLKIAQQFDTKSGTELQMIVQYFSRLINAFGELKRAELSKTMLEKFHTSTESQYESDDFIGFPGSLESSFIGLSCAITSIVTAMTEESKNLMSAITGPVVALDSRRVQISSPLLKKAGDAVTTLNNMDQIFENLCGNYATLTQQFAQYTSQLARDDCTNKSKHRQYANQFVKVLKARKENATSHDKIIESAQRAIDTFRSSVNGLSDILEERNKSLKEIFSAVGDRYFTMASKIQQAADALKDVCSTIDMKKDFSYFVQSQKIARYDLRDLEFEWIDTSDPAFEGIDTKMPVEIAEPYPIGMAHVIKDYMAQGENQMNCRKGKCVMLMEEPDGDWCYAMNPMTLVTGFVPSVCIEKVNGSLGIVIRQSDSFQIGDLLVIVDDTNPAWYVVEDTMGKQSNVSKSIVGIIYS